MTDTTNLALTELIKAMQENATDLLEHVDLASNDLGQGRRNGAIGALASVDQTLERLTALLSAVLVIHRTQPF